MFERLVGLQVKNDQIYQEYRNAMVPILRASGGGFGYDFKVAETLISATDKPINRVFTIYFPDELSSKTFFNSPEYVEVKERYFNQSVQSTTLIADYMKQ